MKNQLTFALSFEKKTVATFEGSTYKNCKKEKMGKSFTVYCTELYVL